jgi:NAD(P)-dependent dehydrogenase (short-subunit alcohol dehydrogenase family)
VSNLSYLPPGSPNILTLSLDVTSKESISRAVAAALAEFGRIDVVVNNAGYFLFGDTENIPESAARKQMETNFFGSVNVTLEALRVFREANIENGGRRGGLIIQISSSSGFVGLTGSAYYNARYGRPLCGYEPI